MVVMEPHSVEAEAAVLGSVMIDPAVMGDVCKIVVASDFFIVKNGWIWDAMLDIAIRNEPIDFLTLCNELETRGQLAEIGGEAYLSQIINSVPTALHADGYARIMKDKSVRRQGLALASDLATRMYDEAANPFVELDRFHHRAENTRVNEAARMGGEIPVLSADEILRAEYPEPYVAVEGMLTSGMAMLGAKSKMHKSWMALQLLCAIASPTGYFMGRQLSHGRVLYVTLELTLRELKNRMQAQSWPGRLPFDVITTETYQQRIGDISKAGADTLCRMMLDKDYKVAVIDPFNLAMAYGQTDMYDLVSMTEAMARLQRFGVEHDRVIMFVVHYPKELRETHDPFADMMGTMGIGNSAGTAWGIYRERGNQMAEMIVAGRNIPEELAIAARFDKQTCTWVYEGKSSDLVLTEQRVEILRVLDLNGEQSHKEIMGKDGGNVSKRLGDLMREELVEEVSTGGKKHFRLTEEGKRKLDEFERASVVKT
jgi:predicted transcriptional regulator